MPGINFRTLHEDLLSILAAIEAIDVSAINANLNSLAVAFENYTILENRKFEWLHEQDPLEINLGP